jgi:hypothetical protein
VSVLLHQWETDLTYILQYCHVFEWPSTGFWIGYWIYWPF